MPTLRIKDIKATSIGFLIKMLKRYIGPYRARRKWLKQTQWYSQDELQKLQLELLKRMVKHAYETVPYYTQLMRDLELKPNDIKKLDDIQKFPILSREDMKTAGNDLVSRKFNRFFLRTTHTGGTTGTRLILKRDLWSISNEHAFVRRQFDWAGIDPSDRCAYMMARVIDSTAQKVKKPYVYDAAMKELTLSVFHLSEETISIYAKAMTDYGVKALVSHPSAAYILAKGCLAKGITLPLKCVLTTSETLDNSKRKLISEAFDCKVYDFYGSAERVCYIHSCEQGSYHVVPEYGLTELLPAESPNEDCCHIVATGFWNMAMPLIRYDTGDLVQLDNDNCQCGRSFPVVKRIVGRESNVLITPSGRMLGASTLEAIMENLLFDMQKLPILEGQVIQESNDVMILEYVPLIEFCQKDADELKSLVVKKFPGDFKVNIRPVKSISRTTSGKAMSLVISQNHPKK